MARFDYFENAASGGYLLDLQADLMSQLATRVVAPLMPLSEAPKPLGRLNPVLAIGEARFVLVTQLMAAIPATELRKHMGSLAHEHDAIMNALDMLFSGF